MKAGSSRTLLLRFTETLQRFQQGCFFQGRKSLTIHRSLFCRFDEAAFFKAENGVASRLQLIFILLPFGVGSILFFSPEVPPFPVLSVP
ncbi:hypothetical protein [Chloracidobacterium thermophilum]|uniref:hypothetical protein n=1 Tax=Chloracidobacterium thermophilum TaxID=458033 RepID=UPI001E2A9A27|nr:hypothetical protein [Chloracidobacterium thermophilum]